MSVDAPPGAFELRRTATAAEVDELEHVGNQVYLRWVLDVAQAHSDACGYPLAAYRSLGAVFVVRRHELDYLAPVRGGDDVVVRTWVERWKAASCVRRTTVTRSDGGQVALQAATTWALVAWPGGRPQRIPEALRAAFG
ncbi:MAG: acyl-CoA thioesterase [Kofleriaceae bacterium]